MSWRRNMAVPASRSRSSAFLLLGEQRDADAAGVAVVVVLDVVGHIQRVPDGFDRQQRSTPCVSPCQPQLPISITNSSPQPGHPCLLALQIQQALRDRLSITSPRHGCVRR